MNLEWAVIFCHGISRIFIILQSHIRSCGGSSQDIEFYDTQMVHCEFKGFTMAEVQFGDNFFTDAIPDYAK
jgi:hypothetical protein